MGSTSTGRGWQAAEVEDKVVRALKRHLSVVAPGLLDILNLYSLKNHNKDLLRLFMESPCSLYKLIAELYKDKVIAAYIFFNLFIKPLNGLVDPNTLRKIYSDAEACISGLLLGMA